MKYKRVLAILLAGCTVFAGAAGTENMVAAADTAKEVKLDPDNPTTVTVWNYYNGDQLAAFENLVSEFNDSVGAEEGIVAVSVSQGSVDNLADSLLDAVSGKIGAQDVPTLASVYAETGYELEKEGMLANLDDYFTQEELDQYISGFVQEGRMTEDGELVLFPVSKSTECFAVNTTDWAEFEKATGVTVDSIDTMEKLTKAAETYYEWTDGLTPDKAEDGKALYGRDSVPNYIFISTKQLGHEMFTVTKDGVSVDLDRDTFKTLWDNYYIPFINGYFAADSSYRSEDMKMGKILAVTSSTSGVSYLPTAVTDESDQTHDIDLVVKPQLLFENAASDVFVQQGADYCVLKSTEEEQYAAVEFLKWFTDPERNLEFSVTSGYSPVTMEANDTEKIKESFGQTDESAKQTNIMDALLVSSDIYTTKETYTCKPFAGSKEVRDVLADALEQTAITDRAAVVEAIAGGKTREEAVEQFSTDEYFDQWFTALCDSVTATVGK